MGQDERRPAVYSAVPKNLTAPYVIPPLEHDRNGRPRPAGIPEPEAPPRQRSWTSFIFVAIAALILIPAVLGLVAGLSEQSSSDGSAPEGVVPVIEAASPAAPVVPAPVIDPASPAVDPAQLKALLDDPAGHEGEQHTAYVEIQVGTETIPESLRDTTGLIGFIGATQPVRALQDAANPVALTADPGVLDSAVSGDVLRIAFVVPPAAGRTTVYNGTGIPELRVVTAERVGTLP